MHSDSKSHDRGAKHAIFRPPPSAEAVKCSSAVCALCYPLNPCMRSTRRSSSSGLALVTRRASRRIFPSINNRSIIGMHARVRCMCELDDGMIRRWRWQPAITPITPATAVNATDFNCWTEAECCFFFLLHRVYVFLCETATCVFCRVYVCVCLVCVSHSLCQSDLHLNAKTKHTFYSRARKTQSHIACSSTQCIQCSFVLVLCFVGCLVKFASAIERPSRVVVVVVVIASRANATQIHHQISLGFFFACAACKRWIARKCDRIRWTCPEIKPTMTQTSLSGTVRNGS